MQKHSIVEVLGCSGSIGIPRQGTTSFLIDDDILIDAGTGVCELDFARLEKIEHVLITHTHLDHICSLPFLVDTVGVGRPRPLRVYAMQSVLDSLHKHIFNEDIWPDFTRIPNETNPVMEFVPLEPEDHLVLGDRTLFTVAVEHTVPAVGVFLKTPTGAWCFSGDTHQTDRLYQVINQMPDIRYFFIESAFPDREKWLADLAKHLCPDLLFAELDKLRNTCEIWISHLKPREHDLIQRELKQYQGLQQLKVLSAGMKFKI
ncbi:MAG TPA: 3',5'-cyclic-nucleotide phosphodiesterase [Limnobacter sp.]|uniref:3',5'-cyclic-nucleotide phosphodiesterase n=1 Tax=Limnobacter sp. TaxID=2003368 RepID=UPI002E2F5D79|nr:3',5'-cyclic-nucleotide phosphodiesterase [Limnobacter sp.]HEX5486797.1 3',5'-cyclic-nucleotide phosphodiesterase [Limnobacter sp.]